MNIQPVNPDTIEQAAELIRSGKLVAFPTETVYGLGADATNDMAVAEIYTVKTRPAFNPLIVHVADITTAKYHVQWSDTAEKLASVFLPGPLTLVMSRLPDSEISLLASAGGDTVGIRIPANKIARDILQAAGVPVAAPSANRSGRVSPTTAMHVYEELGDDIPLILDGGACEVGIESTVVDLSGDEVVLLRPGFVTREQLEYVTGKKVFLAGEGEALKSPGMLASHYAPSLKVRLNVEQPHADEALLAFGPNVPEGAKFIINLSEKGDLKEAAAHLFASLRALDRPDKYSSIAVMKIPDTGIGMAINDRLKRAAA